MDYSSQRNNEIKKAAAAALGNFDGIHLGHLAVMKETLAFAKDGLVPYMVLFDEHSLKEVSGKTPPMIMTTEDRAEIISEYGLLSYTVSFKRIRDFSPERFVKDILIDELNVKAVVCGYNYRFGKNASGDAQTMRELCDKYSLDCKIVGEVDCENSAVSSTEIRRALENGEIKKANRMLGREWSFKAEVIHGDARGRQWGFPTINQKIPDGLVLPRFGVYASKVIVDGREYIGVTNIGRRPTVGTDYIVSETNILDYEGNIYGEIVETKLIDFIRSERKFDSFDDLAAQVKSDIKKIREVNTRV
ncbi:MAG: bifunctional riboflavin kinase/FAD synthetase [Clostridia bacterium]|nr:bifunctional riboflavin kinase/FAD synthetase [Clostridia bacterium]